MFSFRLSLFPLLVSDDGVVGCVNHCGVVDRGEISVPQVKVVHAQQSGPDGFDLDVGEVLSDAAMAACGAEGKGTFLMYFYVCYTHFFLLF